MAIRRVWSGATGAGDGTSWTDAYTTLQAALTAWNVGDVVYVHVGASNPHNETPGSSTTLTAGNSTATERVPVYGVDKDNSDAPAGPSSTAQLDVSGSIYDLSLNFHHEIHRLFFKVGRDVKSVSKSSHLVDTNLTWGTDATSKDLQGANADGSFRVDGGVLNCNPNASGNGQIDLNQGSGRSIFNGVTFEGRADANGLIRSPPSANRGNVAEFVGCDFSGLTNTSTLIEHTGQANQLQIKFVACKLPSSFSAVNGSFTSADQQVGLQNCDDGGDIYRTERYEIGGDVKPDTGVYRDAGWQDKTGSGTATPLSHKYTPSADCDRELALEGIPLVARIGSTGSTTFTIEGLEDFTTALQDDEVWAELYYLGTASEPLWSVATTRVTPGDTASNLTAGTGTSNWTGEGGSARSFKLSFTETINQIGFYMVKVFLGKYEASKAMWIDPLVDVS